MALVKYSKLGNGILTDLAVFNNDDKYLAAAYFGFTSYPYGLFENIFVKKGTNIAPHVVNAKVGNAIRLCTLANGSYIVLRVSAYPDKFTSYGSNYLWETRNISCTVLIYNKSGSEIYNSGSWNLVVPQFKIKSSGEIITGTVYYTLGVDEEKKKIYSQFVCSGFGYPNDTTDKYVATYAIGTNETSFYNALSGNGIEYDPDPWANAGYAGIGGGTGTFDFTSDAIGLPSMPTVDAVSTGFLQLFSGSLSKILELSRYMWSTNFFDNVVKITANPIDIIMGLYMYPFIVPASTERYIRAGNVITNITMGVPDSQIYEINCGDFPVPNFYGSYLDYEPFTKCEIFLPYCGTFPLSMDDIAGETLNVRYRVDLLTGVCTAYVIVGDNVKYNFTGTCAINIPISSRSFENVYNAVLGVVGSSFTGGNFSLPSVGSIAGSVTSGKNQVQHGGSCSGNSGYLGVQKPYLIFSIPRVAIPKGLNKYTGYPIFSTYKLGDLKGYTEIEKIHLENVGQATKEEIDKITGLLEGGVIL